MAKSKRGKIVNPASPYFVVALLGLTALMQYFFGWSDILTGMFMLIEMTILTWDWMRAQFWAHTLSVRHNSAIRTAAVPARHRSSASPSPASTSARIIAGSVVAWPASATIRSCDPGHAQWRSCAVAAGVTTSAAP